MKSALCIWPYLVWLAALSAAQPGEAAPTLSPSRWILGEGMSTFWPVATDARLPHGDFIEQGGLRCGQVVEYHIDEKRQLRMKRGVVWPGLRIIPNDTTGSLIRRYGPEAEPVVSVDGSPIGPMIVEQVLLDGTLRIRGKMGTDLAVTRGTFPSSERRAVIDRWTLYGFRGVLQAGETRTSLRYLQDYTRRRLLGEHVPYPVEVGPEGGQQHLSSESALYCRIFTEGLFGILPIGLDRFRCRPRLPDGWPRMALRSIRAFDRTWDLVVEREDSRMRVAVEQGGKRVIDRLVTPGATVEIVLP